MDDALKTRGNIYLNVETWLLFAPSNQNFWLRDWLELARLKLMLFTGI